MRDKPNDNKQNVWISLLDEVQLNRRNAYGTIELPEKPQLIIFGNESTDKKRLIECINSNKEIHCGIGLDYQFLDLHEDGSEDSLHMGVWCLDGDPQQCNLLKFALNKSNIWHTMGIICIDYTEPWSLINNLELWLQVIEQHINHLKIDSEEIDNLKLSIVYSFKMFTDPSAVKDDVTKSSINLRHQLSLQSQNIAKDQLENTKWSYSPLHPKPLGRNDGVSSSYSQQHSVQSDEYQLDGQDDQLEQKSNEQRSIKWLKNVITEGVMSKLLPIPIMVVITKTEITDTLEKDFGYTDEKFDFILYHLRKLCLEYGAALIYTSVKEAINTNTLVNYIKHRLFDLPLKYSAMLIDPKAIFIQKIDPRLHRSNFWAKPPDVFKELNTFNLATIEKHFSTKTIGADTTPTEEINILQTVEDDQHFLRRMQTMLANMPMPTVTSSLPGSLSNTSSAGSTISSSQPRETSLLTESIPSNIPNQSKPGTTTDKEAVLSSFFNSLLSRKSLTETTPPKTIQSTTGMTSNRINPSTQDNDIK
ncbi:Cytoplasmic dynein 1 light intermediate chain 2 [Schistosoma japonicum]|uniref:Dynein light intermediate chain n=1 Tax=Schistosoma japonicum TaxID=6182 RepID=A0A4Z2D534_SCHJA|nr:Cytoplasmic dynein 1 light intermediate chain 2 [Schistosoma japonicum]